MNKAFYGLSERQHELITARKNFVSEQKEKGIEPTYEDIIAVKYEKHITEIRNAEKAIERYARYYHATEKECPDSFKFLMLMNGWGSPFVALNELLKRIDTNEMMMRRTEKRSGKKTDYKSRYKEMRGLVQKWANEH